MNITVRFYRLHDFDLLYLYKIMGLRMGYVMKECLRAYVRGNPISLKISVPDVQDNITVETIKQGQLHINLKESEDADVIIFLNSLRKLHRNSFLKNLLRGYLNMPVAFAYQTQITEETKNRQDSFNTLYKDELKFPKAKERTGKKKQLLSKHVAEIMASEGIDVTSDDYVIKEKI